MDQRRNFKKNLMTNENGYNIPKPMRCSKGSSERDVYNVKCHIKEKESSQII